MFQKIVLAYDGGEETANALHQAAELARSFNAELILIGIVATVPGTALAEPYGEHDFLTAGRSHIETALLNVAEELRNRNIKVATEVGEGNPASEIAACAQRTGADLVVIGHTNKGLLKRWLEGSTGARLIRDLPCSLLIATGK